MSARTILSLSIVVLLSCTDVSTPTEPSAYRPQLVPDVISLGTSCSTSSAPNPVGDHFRHYWSCGDVIRLIVDGSSAWPSGMQSAVNQAASQAADEWESPLHAANSNMPVIRYGASSYDHTITLTWDNTGVGSGYCGLVRDASGGDLSGLDIPGRIVLFRCSGTTDVQRLILHELSHAYGYLDWWENHPAGTYASSCARWIAVSAFPANSEVCPHEIESLFYAYKVRSTDVSLDKSIIWQIRGSPTAPSIHQGDSVELSVVGVYDHVDPETSLPLSAATYTFASSDGDVSLSGSGTSRYAKGVNVGAADVTVVPTSSAHEIATFLNRYKAHVTISAPPPPPSGEIDWWPNDCQVVVKQLSYRVIVDTSALVPGDSVYVAETTTSTPPTGSPTVIGKGSDSEKYLWLADWNIYSSPSARYIWLRKKFAAGTFGDWTEPSSYNMNPYPIDECVVW